MMRKILTAGLLALAAAVPARADFFTPTTFTFDPTSVGGTGPVTAFRFQYAPGNVIAVGGNAAVQNFLTTGAQTPFPVLFQSSMSAVQNTGGSNLNVGNLNQAGGYQLTIVGRLTETVATGSSAAAVLFKQTPAVGDFVQIWANPINVHNDLAGTGFQTGTMIYSATAVANPATAFDSNFSTSSRTPVALDNFNGNSYPGVNSVQGVGASTLYGISTFFDPAFFPDAALLGLISGLTQAQTFQNLPFANVDPAALFFDGTIGVASVGALNGGLSIFGEPFAPNIMFQTNFVQEFGVVGVPEPATLTLAVVGLAGVGLAGIRRRRGAR
jgi:hypothetical protein